MMCFISSTPLEENTSSVWHTIGLPTCHGLLLSQLIFLYVFVAAAILDKVGKPNIKLQMVGDFENLCLFENVFLFENLIRYFNRHLTAFRMYFTGK